MFTTVLHHLLIVLFHDLELRILIVHVFQVAYLTIVTGYKTFSCSTGHGHCSLILFFMMSQTFSVGQRSGLDRSF